MISGEDSLGARSVNLGLKSNHNNMQVLYKELSDKIKEKGSGQQYRYFEGDKNKIGGISFLDDYQVAGIIDTQLKSAEKRSEVAESILKKRPSIFAKVPTS